MKTKKKKSPVSLRTMRKQAKEIVGFATEVRRLRDKYGDSYLVKVILAGLMLPSKAHPFGTQVKLRMIYGTRERPVLPTLTETIRS